jgi:hypothetical protein
MPSSSQVHHAPPGCGSDAGLPDMGSCGCACCPGMLACHAAMLPRQAALFACCTAAAWLCSVLPWQHSSTKVCMCAWALCRCGAVFCWCRRQLSAMRPLLLRCRHQLPQQGAPWDLGPICACRALKMLANTPSLGGLDK